MAYPDVGAMAGLGAHHGRRHGDHLRGPVGLAILCIATGGILG